IDRQALSVNAPHLRRDLGLSATQYSYLVTAFLIAYTIGPVDRGTADRRDWHAAGHDVRHRVVVVRRVSPCRGLEPCGIPGPALLPRARRGRHAAVDAQDGLGVVSGS